MLVEAFARLAGEKGELRHVLRVGGRLVTETWALRASQVAVVIYMMWQWWVVPSLFECGRSW